MFVNMAYLNVSYFRTCQMCDKKSSNGWTVVFLHSSNSLTQIVKVGKSKLEALFLKWLVQQESWKFESKRSNDAHLLVSAGHLCDLWAGFAEI